MFLRLAPIEYHGDQGATDHDSGAPYVSEDSKVDATSDRKEIGQDRTDANRLDRKRIRLTFPGLGRPPVLPLLLELTEDDLI